MPRPEPSLRQQLIDARAKVLRQIDRLRDWPHPAAAMFGSSVGTVDNRELIAKLTETLRQIDDSLARLGPADV
jgi:hypothetical protein